MTDDNHKLDLVRAAAEIVHAAQMWKRNIEKSLAFQMEGINGMTKDEGDLIMAIERYEVR